MDKLFTLKTFYKVPLLITVASLFWLLVACSATHQTPVLLKGTTMGTYWQASIAAKMNEAEKAALQAKIEADLKAVNQSMSTYIPDSELELLNHNSQKAPIPISPELRKVIAKGLEISKQSDGYYDITVAPLVDLWGFGPKKVTSAPSAEEVAVAKSRVGYQKITLSNEGIQKSQPDIEIDLSSIAKGYGVDVVAEQIEKSGYQNYLVDIGGEVRAGGSKFGQPWRVGIELPEEVSSHSIQSVIALKDENIALATSGNYRNYADYGSVHAVHTINPKTGMTEQSALLSVTVVAQDCMTADAYATALMALGDKKAENFANQLGLSALFITAVKDGKFQVTTTDAYQKSFGGEK
ncbi:FAD:protein FMN transferase [Suttonella ornithocola]|uniref:FAD:protein FMN transferase n=1 Tax=Suttonella ornithocola TaxID=279832 RepID=UPI000A4D0C2C|nr:FAD:protein FMN transferase [Suttonella ornithocola]